MVFSKIASLAVYLCTYTVSAACLHFSTKTADKFFRVIFYFFALFVAVYFATVRYNVGTDYGTYASMCKSIWDADFSDIFDKFGFDSTPLGVFIFAKIARIFNSVEVFFLLFALISFISVSSVIIKLKDSVSVFLMSFAFLTTLYTSGFNMMKQCVAISFVLCAVQCVISGKPFRFTLLCTVACCFHPTALIILPIYFLRNRKQGTFDLSYRKSILFVLGSIALLIVYPKILTAIGGRFEDYLNDGVSGNNLTFFLHLGWFFIFFIVRNYLLDNECGNSLFFLLFLIGILYEFLGFRSPYIKRIALYFLMVDIILIPQVPSAFTKEYKPFISLMIYLYYILLFVVDYYLLLHANIIPFMVK